MLLTPARGFTLLYIAQFLFLGVQLPFFPGWLYEIGFSEKAIGLVTGGSLILRLLLGPVVAYWAESQRDQRIILGIISALMFVSAALLLVGQPAWSIALLTITMMWSFGCLVPLTDTAVMRADKAGALDYGRTRAFGSGAFVFANLAGGLLIARTGDAASVAWMAGASLLALVVILGLPKGAERQEGAGASRLAPPKLSEAVRLFRSKSFLLMLTAAGLTQGAHAVYYAFSKLHWSSLGYGSDLIGVLWTIGVVAEIMILFFGRPLLRRFGPVLFIGAGALAAFIRWPLIGLSPPLPVVFLLQTLHAFTFATVYLGTVEFISRAVPRNLENTGMTLVSTLGVGALTGVATIIAGLFFTAANPFPAYAMMGAMGAAALLATLGLWRHWDGGIIRSERGAGDDAPVDGTGGGISQEPVPVPDRP
ncbi:MFS transporter [Aquisalinus flavus]|uniref:MFS transporter n=1 Tax=Aquisalinus flavus TaxID=1526572 RepID=A0A8J2Y6D3_9PROT|nr:MFS transporter [Aquisalinus flavus]MBD0427503.1 MFS transporter [Aquisalinus flavus]UNE47298.1 MFS transporter [Aquisalinus flavus]GGD01502.1 MFS transporter [Aquisalinus flavus]